jgi:hypothetical protein
VDAQISLRVDGEDRSIIVDTQRGFLHGMNVRSGLKSANGTKRWSRACGVTGGPAIGPPRYGFECVNLGYGIVVTTSTVGVVGRNGS